MKLFYSIFLILSFFIFPVSLSAGASKTVSIDDVSVTELDSNTTITFTVTCDGSTEANDNVEYTIYSGSATAGNDYLDNIELNGTVKFLPASNTAPISITIIGDDIPEADETFTVVLSNLVTNDNHTIADGTGVGTIVNDDTQDWPPIMGDIPDQGALRTIFFTLDISSYVTEVNGDTVSYDLNGTLPAGLDFNTTSGILSGTPTVVGSFDLTVRAIDKDTNASNHDISTDDFNILVQDIEDVFCYGYTYKQQGLYFTEENNGTQPPMLDGEVAVGADVPITMSLYIKNRSNFDIEDLNVTVFDMNNSQVTYMAGTTKLVKVNQVTITSITDSATPIASLDIGDIDSNQHIYVYYDLEPQISELYTPIDVDLTFGLGGTVTQTLGSEVEMCTASTSSNDYNSTYRIFNVEHVSQFADQKYNLPTQIINRADNFKIVSYDADFLNTRQDLNGTAHVELIEIGAFGSIDTDCNNPLSSISERILVKFVNSDNTDFTASVIDADIIDITTTSSDFYRTAIENTAFRVSYNVLDDNGSMLDIEAYDGGWIIKNFTELAQGVLLANEDLGLPPQDLNKCREPVVTEKKTYTTMPESCGNNSDTNPIDDEQLAICLECVYGFFIEYACSRDNFSIRPEAFMIKIDDQNQTNPTSQVRVADDVSGVDSAVAPTTTEVNMAADYNYEMEVTATSSLGNDASFGYTQALNANHTWEPRTVTPTGCTDYSNKTTSLIFTNGYAVESNATMDNVGEYRLSLTDTSWTAVDQNASHHTGEYYNEAAYSDCTQDNSDLTAIGSSTPNGCNISSSHTNTDANLIYRDYNTTFHPYKFDMTGIVPSHSIGNNETFNANTFIYMSDMSQDENMSFHLNGPIRAAGYYDLNLSNFVENCYAKPVTLSINKSAISGAVAYKSRFNSLESDGTVILPTNADMNGTVGTIDINTTNFKLNMVGSINTNHNLNFDRNLTIVMNPEELTFSSYDTNCTYPENDCTFSADLTSKTTQGVFDLNQTIKHYYGRTHASTQRYHVPDDAPYIANVYYEVYCFGDINGSVCDPLLLQQGTNSRRVDDIRWFTNESHTSNKGTAGTTTEIDGLGVVTGTTTGGNHLDSTILTYNGTTLYITTMENSASGWLIYNEDDPTATRNQFQVYFLHEGDWTGKHETDVTTKKDANVITNRRTMW